MFVILVSYFGEIDLAQKQPKSAFANESANSANAMFLNDQHEDFKGSAFDTRRS